MTDKPIDTQPLVEPKIADAPPIVDPHKELNRPDIPDVRVPPTPLPKAEMEPSLVRQAQHLIRQYIKQGFRITLLESLDQFHRRFFGLPLLRFSRLAANLHVGGQYNRRGWKRLQNERGIDAVINLRAEFDEHEAGFGPDDEHYCYLPTPDGFPPSVEDLHEGVTFMRERIAEGEAVYVHCWEGVGRAPTLVAAYLVSTGLTPSEAWGKLKALRPFIRPTAAQLWAVDQFAYEWGNQEQPSLTMQLAEKSSNSTND
jgi:protein-tyrosine phosphatase